MKIKAVLFVPVCIAVALAGPVVLPTGAWTMTTKTTKPLLDLCYQLVSKYNWLVTYEEAPVLNPSELHSAVAPTGLPMRELNATPVLFDVPQIADNSITTKAAILTGVIHAYNARGNRGAFKLVQSGDYLHVVPTSVLAADGTVESFQPLLDTPVTFPVQQYHVLTVVNWVISQISQKRGVPVVLATYPVNLFAQAIVTEGANEVPARDVLARLSSEINQLPGWRDWYGTPIRLKWDLLYFPTGQNFFLNVGSLDPEAGFVPTPPAEAATPATPAPPSGNPWWRKVPTPKN
jgi:hypothetical protein